MTQSAIRAALAFSLFLLPASTTGSQEDPRLEQLFQQLLDAPDPRTARLYEDAIWRVWLQSDDPELDELMRRGLRAMEGRHFERALERFGDAIERAPNYAEGWNKRATVLFFVDRFEASIADIEKTLALEPRHFGAWSGLGQIRDSLGEPEAALEAYERALAVHPNLGLAKRRVKALRQQLEMQPI